MTTQHVNSRIISMTHVNLILSLRSLVTSHVGHLLENISYIRNMLWTFLGKYFVINTSKICRGHLLGKKKKRKIHQKYFLLHPARCKARLE